MKKLIVVAFASLALMGCGDVDPVQKAREHEAAMLKLKQEHELNMARIQAQPQQQAVYSEPAQSSVPSYQSGSTDVYQPDQSSSSDSGIGGTILAVGAGALAGYAISELLDDGYRSYTDQSGRTVYVDKNNRQIDKRDYEAYKAKHPTKHALSSYNQKGKQAINTGATKTVEAGQAVKAKTVEAAKKVDQKVVQPTKQTVQKKYNNFKKSSSTKKK